MQHALGSGESNVRDLIGPVKHVGEVRRNTLSRLVFVAYHVARSACPDALGHFKLTSRRHRHLLKVFRRTCLLLLFGSLRSLARLARSNWLVAAVIWKC